MKKLAAMAAALLALASVTACAVTPVRAATTACRGYVGLTFDDGPTAGSASLIAILRRFHATATFFDVGANMRRYPAFMTQEAAIGQIANHSYSHPFLDQMTYRQVYDELLGTSQIAWQEARRRLVLFRPPFDRVDHDVTMAQYHLGLLTALWSIDSQDYDGIPVSRIERNVWRARPGDVILFHDGLATTRAALPGILRHFQSEGLCAGELIPSARTHLAWHTADYGNVVFYARVAAPGTPAPTVASLHLTPRQQSTAVGPGA